MCIRDRNNSFTIELAGDLPEIIRTLLLVLFIKGATICCAQAVSYTHLDVYKRQQEESRASLILYKKRSAKPYVEIPFTEENRTGNVYAMYITDFNLKEYEYNFLINGKVYTCLLYTSRCV